MKNKVPGKRVLNVIYFMKISTLVLAIIWCLSFTVISGEANGQVLKKRLSINIKNKRLYQALDLIAAATGVTFTFNESVANSMVKVSVSANRQTLSVILDRLLLNTPFTYEVVGDDVLIKQDDRQRLTLNPPPRTLTGQISDEKDQVLSGATVKVKGTKKGTITDAEGRYKIMVYVTDVLVYSFVGFEPREAAIGSNKTINIKLDPKDDSELKEVAVVAYGTQKKISLIGAQSTVEPDDLKQPVGSFTNLLAGRISGIVGVQYTGEPGKDASSIYIRGLSSFISSSNIGPLTLVDGVERSIELLNIDDIQSFTILKDASATAVYGVRGANGVVLVQTKRGKPGPAIVRADYYEGISSFTKTPQMADGLTYMQAVNEALTTRGQSPKYSADYISKTTNKFDQLLYPDVSWLDAIFNKTSDNRKANVNVSGGGKTAAYYLSGSFLDQTGLLKADQLESYDPGINYSRYNFVSNVDVQLGVTTKANFGLNGYIAKGNYPSQSPSSIFGYAMTVPPTEFPVTYPGGFVPGKTANGSEPNPYGQLTRSGFATEYDGELNTQLRLTHDLNRLVPGLNISAIIAYDTENGHAINRYKNPDTWQLNAQDPYNSDGSLNLVKTSSGSGDQLNFTAVNSGHRNLYLESSLNYDHEMGNHHFGGLLLYNQREASVYPAYDEIMYLPHRERGVSGRIIYSYSNRYFAELNAGYTGSDNFAPGKRYGFFPSYGFGWLISEEPFFKEMKSFLTMFKIRYSNGYVGSDDTGGPRFGYLTVLRQGASGYTFGTDRNGITGIAISTYGITTTWSTSHKQNLGIDLNLFNKLSLTVDLFKERRENVIIQRGSVPLFVGLTSTTFANLGVIGNRGIDATLAGHQKIGALALGFNATLTYNKARIIDNDQQTSPYPWMEKRGHSPIATFGYIADGLFKTQDEINKSAVPGDKTILKPGDIKYRDLNGDGIINAYDMTAISEGELPPLTFGAGFNVVFKNLFLNAFFVGNINGKRYINGPAIQPFSTNGGISNAYLNITDRWTESNPSQNVFYPRLAYGNAANANNTAISSWWMKDMGFVRLKTVDLGYNLPKKILDKVRLSNAAVYFEGYNVFTLTKFKLWDPEAGTANGTQYPNIKTLVVGLRAQFN
jgi:TonB-linked SusC/RagA family outer membrane protein